MNPGASIPTPQRSLTQSRECASVGTHLEEGGAALGAGSVQHSAVDQDDAQVAHGVVGVLRHSAAHPTGIVGDNATYHARVDGGGVRPNLVNVVQVVLLGVRGQDAVNLPADESGLHRDLLASILKPHSQAIRKRPQGWNFSQG